MKFYTKLAIVGWPCVFALAWTAMAMAEPDTDINQPAEPEIAQDSIQRLAREIHDRVGMSCSFEVVLENGKDPIQEAYESGYIIDVTLEEVEAALAAAALTPEIEDDQAAMDLKHRGSYRFFP